MLTKRDKQFLEKVPTNKKVTIKPFNPKARRLGEEIIKNIKETFPHTKVVYTGSTMLGIYGQQDIDIFVLANPNDFDRYLPFLKDSFGEPKHTNSDSINWDIKKNGFVIDLYLSSPKNPGTIRQLKILDVLGKNKELLKEYDTLKKKMDGKPMKEYQKKKFEFFNKILDENY